MRRIVFVAALAATSAQALDLTLQGAVEATLAGQRALRSTGYALEGEQLSLATARSAFDLKILPTGSIGRIESSALTTTTGYNGSVGVQLFRKFESTGTEVSIGPSYNRTAGESNTGITLHLAQPLLRGWDSVVTLDPVRRAEHSVASSQRSFEQARVNAALEVIAAYYAVLREERLAAFAAAQLKRIDEHTAIAEIKERSGLIGPMDLLRAKVRLTDAQDAANLARISRQAALNRLRRAMDVPLDSDLRLAPPRDVRVEDADYENEAIERRIEIVQLRAELDEAVRASEVARRNIRPEVTLHVTAGQSTTINPFLVQFVPATSRQWSVYLESSAEFSRKAEENAFRQALLRVENARAILETRVEEVRRQVREQRLALADLRVRIALREEQIRQAQSRLALAQVKFSHDMASNVDVIEAETELQRAEASLAGARAEYAVGVYQLKAVAGRLLPFA
jgi:adhesin transport system outer membrane protein